MIKILIVEDHPTNRKLIVLILEKAGYEVLQAASAEEALKLACKEQPALILMDIQLPGMNGLDATRLLKQDSLTCKIPVVAVTAMAMKGDSERIEAAGCDGYVAKPLRYKELWHAVEYHLGKIRSE
jgi:two-component system cell cycle response regulator DivK